MVGIGLGLQIPDGAGSAKLICGVELMSLSRAAGRPSRSWTDMQQEQHRRAATSVSRMQCGSFELESS